MTYRNKTKKCEACSYNTTLEHQLYHQSGLNESSIKKCGFQSIYEIENAFSKARYVTPCFILLNEKKVKIKEKNQFLAYEEFINLIKD